MLAWVMPNSSIELFLVGILVLKCVISQAKRSLKLPMKSSFKLLYQACTNSQKVMRSILYISLISQMTSPSYFTCFAMLFRIIKVILVVHSLKGFKFQYFSRQEKTLHPMGVVIFFQMHLNTYCLLVFYPMGFRDPKKSIVE